MIVSTPFLKPQESYVSRTLRRLSPGRKSSFRYNRYKPTFSHRESLYSDDLIRREFLRHRAEPQPRAVSVAYADANPRWYDAAHWRDIHAARFRDGGAVRQRRKGIRHDKQADHQRKRARARVNLRRTMYAFTAADERFDWPEGAATAIEVSID